MLLGILGTIAAVSMTFDAMKAKPRKALPKEPATPPKKEPKVKPTKTPSEEFALPSAHTTGLLSPYSLLDKHYQIMSSLGQGGMGAVYKAADIKLGNRPVAVKEMSLHGLDAQKVTEAIDAFKREALLLARLHHPHLPHIYDHFEEGGRWYLVMDFIEGETLQEYLETRGGTTVCEGGAGHRHPVV
ncbi:protein kinase domain-containing protein [Ktedonospora formicarum]|uniref:Protein kinase domain-containing protein n=1 Tax=Ktedonospora formicarum TaxID=2778364 RepID=A0A8J3I5E4_9CHLR|nr:protein kinase [Ktedonospora formicarum]GHO49874.1 hypothetical protein KSX_80370 [Ktedonospora formicarum]